MEPRTTIVTNINGTYTGALYILSHDGSVTKISGARANDSVIEE